MTRLISAVALVLVFSVSVSFGQNTEARTRVQEWTAAWSGLEPQEKQELTDAWRNAIETYRGLLPSGRRVEAGAHDLRRLPGESDSEQRAKAGSSPAIAVSALSHEQKQLIRVMTDGSSKLVAHRSEGDSARQLGKVVNSRSP
jgi:hypothetical protein